MEGRRRALLLCLCLLCLEPTLADVANAGRIGVDARGGGTTELIGLQNSDSAMAIVAMSVFAILCIVCQFILWREVKKMDGVFERIRDDLAFVLAPLNRNLLDVSKLPHAQYRRIQRTMFGIALSIPAIYFLGYATVAFLLASARVGSAFEKMTLGFCSFVGGVLIASFFLFVGFIVLPIWQYGLLTKQAAVMFGLLLLFGGVTGVYLGIYLPIQSMTALGHYTYVHLVMAAYWVAMMDIYFVRWYTESPLTEKDFTYGRNQHVNSTATQHWISSMNVVELVAVILLSFSTFNAWIHTPRQLPDSPMKSAADTALSIGLIISVVGVGLAVYHGLLGSTLGWITNLGLFCYTLACNHKGQFEGMTAGHITLLITYLAAITVSGASKVIGTSLMGYLRRPKRVMKAAFTTSVRLANRCTKMAPYAGLRKQVLQIDVPQDESVGCALLDTAPAPDPVEKTREEMRNSTAVTDSRESLQFVQNLNNLNDGAVVVEHRARARALGRAKEHVVSPVALWAHETWAEFFNHESEAHVEFVHAFDSALLDNMERIRMYPGEHKAVPGFYYDYCLLMEGRMWAKPRIVVGPMERILCKAIDLATAVRGIDLEAVESLDEFVYQLEQAKGTQRSNPESNPLARFPAKHVDNLLEVLEHMWVAEDTLTTWHGRLCSRTQVIMHEQNGCLLDRARHNRDIYDKDLCSAFARVEERYVADIVLRDIRKSSAFVEAFLGFLGALDLNENGCTPYKLFGNVLGFDPTRSMQRVKLHYLAANTVYLLVMIVEISFIMTSK